MPRVTLSGNKLSRIGIILILAHNRRTFTSTTNLKKIITMQYLQVDEELGHLSMDTGECPTRKNNEVLIEVVASGINRADLLQIAGHYPPPAGASEIVGLEVSGIILQAPENCRFEKGDKVIALLSGGGYAQYVAVDLGSVMPLPQRLDFIEGAGIAEAFVTAYQALFKIGNLNTRLTTAKPRVLIHAGASGVGCAAIQLALSVGCEVYVTASSKEKLEALSKFGKIIPINYKQQCFNEVISEATGKQGVDVIVDFIGGDYLAKNIDCVALDGTIITLAMLGGRFGPQLDFAKLLSKRVTLCGSILRNRSTQYKTDLVHAFETQFLEKFESAELRPTIDSSYLYSDVNTALARIANNKNIGKLILYGFKA